MQNDTKQVVCMKWGTLYGSEYVNKLYAMVRRNTTGNLRFVCLTDDPKGINENVEIMECPSIPIREPYNNTGWRKITLWNSNLFALEGNWLFLDLDVVIVESINSFFNYKKEATFIVMQNWTQPGKNIGNTSVYRFTVGAHDYLYENLVNDEDNILSSYANEQTYVSKTIQNIEFWPDEWCVLFKVQCIPSLPIRFFKEAAIPKGAKIVAFPGVPNPHQAITGTWPAKWYKKWYKTIKPVSWVEKHWKI